MDIESIKNTVIHGDNLDVLPTLPDNSVDAIVTDPPYGLSFMGKKRDYDVPSQKLREECLRVLKPGGYLLAFAGTRTQHRMAVRIEDAGFEIRDMIAWVYGSGFPKSLNIGKGVSKINGEEREVIGIKPGHEKFVGRSSSNFQQRDRPSLNNPERQEKYHQLTKGTSEREGRGTALKPALEPITVARKPLSEKTVAENVLKWGTGGINIDGCRVGTEVLGGGTMPDLRDVGAMSKENSGIDKLSFGQNHRPAERKEQPEYTGRFPANFIHDGSDEVVSLFPDSKGGAFPKSINGNSPISFRGNEEKESRVELNDNGSAARFFYCPKASKSERNMGCEDLEEKFAPKGNNEGRDMNNPKNHLGGMQSSKMQNNHPTVKPIALMEYLVKLVSKEGAIVLDPFAGSGSTLIACKRIDRQYIGIEMTEEYIPIIEARLNAVVKEEPEQDLQPSLF